MTKIKKLYDKTINLYFEVEKELKAYLKQFQKLNFKKGFTHQEYLDYMTLTYQKRKEIDSILKRLRIKLKIISILKYI